MRDVGNFWVFILDEKNDLPTSRNAASAMNNMFVIKGTKHLKRCNKERVWLETLQ